jgi:DNA-binding transcriptional LysR family regulator
MAASISMSGQIQGLIPQGLFIKRYCCRVGELFYVDQNIRSQNATSLKDLIDAEWVTTSITPKAEKELGVLFKRYGLPEPTLAMRSQSALTLLTCLAHSDLLAMAPAQWTISPFANRVLTAIPVREELSAPAIILVTRSDVPPSPAAGFFIDLIKRAADHIGYNQEK